MVACPAAIDSTDDTDDTTPVEYDQVLFLVDPNG